MLRTDTVEPILISTLKQLMQLDFLADFHLVGGTGLALYLGHRKSIDIDLFTWKEFDSTELSLQLANTFKEHYTERSAKNVMLFSFINEVKADFVNTRVPLLFPVQNIEGVRIADVRDIAILKFQAILKRGSKKDFIDLFVLLQQFSIEEMFQWFNQKYPNVETAQLLISMTYFEDAEADLMPVLFFNATWKEIKESIRNKVNQFIRH